MALVDQLQQLGPTLYWELLNDLLGKQRRVEFDLSWSWFSLYARAGSRGKFFAAHRVEMEQLLRLQSAELIENISVRIQRRRARTDARVGVVVRATTSAADLIVGYAVFLLVRLNQNLAPASWIGGLFVLSERAGKSLVCWAQGERFELSSVAAQLLVELGDTRQLYADDRHLKQLEEQFPPIRGLMRRGSVQGNHRTTIRGVGLVGRVVDLVSPKA